MLELLPGFRDFYPADCALRNALFKKWRGVASCFNFSEFDCPILEPLELFTEKSGEEIVQQLFAFEDRGGRKVAMRPETTPSLVRLIGARAHSLKKPIKWFNITENFRYERPQKGRLRSFYQFNVDIIGEKSIFAEAELIALAVESFKAFGLTRQHFYVRLSDRQLWMLWLECFGVEQEATKIALLSLFDKWERRPQEEIEKDLAHSLPAHVDAKSFFEKTVQLRQAQSLEAVRTCFSDFDPNVLSRVESRLSDWQALLDELSTLQCGEFIKIDLGIVRGLAYYTGFVFEVFDAGLEGRALAGGGRYDQLFEKLSGHSLAAVGFAAGDVTLTELLRKNNLLPNCEQTLKFFVVCEEGTRREALQDACLLRERGASVAYVFGAGQVCSVSKQLKKAFESNPEYILFYGSNELQHNQVQVRRVGSNELNLVNRDQLIQEFCQ